MNFVPIFDDSLEFWAVCYPEDDGEHIFDKIFNQWHDTEFLLGFFVSKKAELASEFWKGLSIDDAIEAVIEQAVFFEEDLISIINQDAGCEGQTLREVFEALHKGIALLVNPRAQQRKGKPNKKKFPKSMLRLYALELEDGTFLVTGGAIKLEEKMEGSSLVFEKQRLDRVQHYLKENGITNREGLT